VIDDRRWTIHPAIGDWRNAAFMIAAFANRSIECLNA
jgi:hypothetical protein